jgi:DNA-binding beta-propeller fold protein YncE
MFASMCTRLHALRCLTPFLLLLTACTHAKYARTESTAPLELVTDVALPGGATRFDYQDVDTAHRQLVVVHMHDNAVEILDLQDGSLRGRVTGIATPRGIAVAPDINRIFVTSKPGELVIIDSVSLREVRRVKTGTAPDGDAWDPVDKIVAVSDQRDGALSLISNSGEGERRQIPLGVETGNVIYDSARRRFWITVVGKNLPDQLVAVDPLSFAVTERIDIPGCQRTHGLRLHPDGRSAFIACEQNDLLVRVELAEGHRVTSAATGHGPDVLAIDPALGWLYVAPESGDVTIFDINQPGLSVIGVARPGENAHTVAEDPGTHRVFFPLMRGPAGTPVLRVMKPKGHYAKPTK